jgi:hypothetical protein
VEITEGFTMEELYHYNKMIRLFCTFLALFNDAFSSYRLRSVERKDKWCGVIRSNEFMWKN